MFLHKLLARHLDAVVDLLSELHEIHTRLSMIIILLVSNLIDALVAQIARLRVRIAHVERRHRVAQLVTSAIRHDLRVSPRFDLARRQYSHPLIIVLHEGADA